MGGKSEKMEKLSNFNKNLTEIKISLPSKQIKIEWVWKIYRYI